MIQFGSLDPSAASASGSWVPDPDHAGEEVELSALAPLAPSKKDRVRVLEDSDSAPAGTAGLLIGIDGNDGIVKVDNSSDLLIVPLATLGRFL